jgi:hypothetical protein
MGAPAEKGGIWGNSPRALLLGGLALAILVAAVLVATMAGGRAPAETGGEVTGDLSGSNDPADDSNASPSGRTVDGAATGMIEHADDPVATGVDRACSMFRDGATVEQFTAWFEADVGTVGPTEQELIQVIMVQALTETCPEVIPKG